MKKLSKVLVLVLSAIMVLAMSASVFAATSKDSGKGGSASIQITLPTDNAGTNEEITYHVYKVFDATNDGTSSAISYKIDSVNGSLTSAMTEAGFSVDAAGNVSGPASLNEAALAAIKAYATDEIVVEGGFKAKPSDGTLTITGLEYGYYYITTTTGAAVTVDSTNPNAEVQDKNVIPGKPDKTIVEGDDFVGSLDEAGKNAIAQVGSKVYFSVDIDVVAGASNYVFHDKMTDGLAYDATSLVVNPADSVANTTTAQGDTLTVTFDNDWLATNAGQTITITYAATVTEDAITVNAEENTASLDYGDGHKTETDTVKVYNASFTVTKNQPAKADEEGAVLNEEDGKYYKPLAGAGFVVKNSDNKYYKLDNGVVTWVDSINEATEYTSNAQGAVTAFTGLADGTYTLVEKTVPAGYNKAADSTFTVEEGDYTADNLAQTATVTNNGGTELPSTGGIGTTIFYILGTLLVVGCGIVLVSRKRMEKNN